MLMPLDVTAGVKLEVGSQKVNREKDLVKSFLGKNTCLKTSVFLLCQDTGRDSSHWQEMALLSPHELISTLQRPVSIGACANLFEVHIPALRAYSLLSIEDRGALMHLKGESHHLRHCRQESEQLRRREKGQQLWRKDSKCRSLGG